VAGAASAGMPRDSPTPTVTIRYSVRETGTRKRYRTVSDALPSQAKSTSPQYVNGATALLVRLVDMTKLNVNARCCVAVDHLAGLSRVD